MKKPILIGFICELALAACALACLIIAAVLGSVGLVIGSALVMLALLYIAGGFLMEHLKPGCNYFDWVAWFWTVFCVQWTWEIFCKKWTWEIFCKQWTWEIFCKKWTWEIFCKKWTWETFCKAWVWQTFCVNILYKKFDKWKAWLYLSPALILLAIFTVWPLINTIKMAFTVYWDPTAANWDEAMEHVVSYGAWKGYNINLDIGGKTQFVFGFDNFIEVIKYDGFSTVMKNTILLCVATVPLSTFIALVIAVCLNAIKPLKRFLQTIFFLPYVTNSIAIGMVFAAMFNIVGVKPLDLEASASLGIINWAIQKLGFDPVNWINQGSLYPANIAVMIVYIVWNALPFKILILLGGLQSVNKQYYEAAKVDATPRWRVFTRITVPLLSPMITYVVITGFIGGFKEYTSIVGIFGKTMQPPGAGAGTARLQTMVGYIYDKLGKSEGTASAAAIILFLLIFAVTLVNLKISKKNTHY